MLLPDDTILLVIGSQAANPADRSLGRGKIQSAQYLDHTGVWHPLPRFQAVGAHGVAAMCHDPAHSRLYVSGGENLFYIDLNTGTRVEVPINGILDTHEIEIHDSQLYLTSTGNDEYFVIDTNTHAYVSQSIMPQKIGVEADKHHLNHIQRGLDGKLYGLVHHVDGKQFLSRIAAKALKSHGSGGVIRLEDGVRFPLRLHGPHSISVVGKEYWIFDSGQSEIKVLSANWEELRIIPTRGWGRGAEQFKLVGRHYFVAGISNIRQRYQHLFKNANAMINGIEIIDVQTEVSIFSCSMVDVEQVNNVYCLSRSVLPALIAI